MEKFIYTGVYMHPASGTAEAVADENIIPALLQAAGARTDSIKEFELHTSEECSVVINGTHAVGTKQVGGSTDAVLIIDRPLRRPDVSAATTRNDGGWGITSLVLGAAVNYYIVFYY